MRCDADAVGVIDKETLVTHDELYNVMRQTYNELLELIETAGFQSVLEELYELPEGERPRYVEEILLRPERLTERGVVLPQGILLQRSSFGDRRPTLFCIKKYLPERYQAFWENVNITFDNPYEDSTIPRDESAWRKPIPIEVQALLLSAGITPKELGIA